MNDRTGQQFGNYRLIRLLGQGGFAEVYLGEHVYLKTQAAIKILKTPLTPEHMEVFRQEAQTIARLKHPHIVRILEFGVDNTPFLVMDYAPHGTLRQRHPKESMIPLATIVSYVRQIASALQYAHNAKLIHRDVKPENMLLGDNNEVILSDFGIAAVAHSTSSLNILDHLAGTPSYMAPEQLRCKPLPASDQYALGITVYEWLCRTRPFDGNPMQLMYQHLHASPPPLSEKIPVVSSLLEQVVLQALAKDPQQRFASVQAFADALEQASQSSTFLGTTVRRNVDHTAPGPAKTQSHQQQALEKQLEAGVPRLVPIGKPVFQEGNPHWLKWDEPEQHFSIRNMGTGAAFNIASVLHGCESYVVNHNRSDGSDNILWTYWSGAHIAQYERIECAYKLGGAMFFAEDKYIGEYHFNAPAEPTLADIYQGASVHLARIVLTYQDDRQRKHASICDYVEHKGGWQVIAFLSDIEEDLDDIQRRSLRGLSPFR